MKPDRLLFSKIKIGLKKGRKEGSLHIDQLEIDLSEDLPKYFLKHQGKDFPLSLLLTILGSEALIVGESKLDLELTMFGKTIETLKRSMSGRIELDIKKGTIYGLDLISSLKEAKSILTTLESKIAHTLSEALEVLLHRKHEIVQTPFSSLKIKAKIDHGKLVTDDFIVRHPKYRLQGSGAVNFRNNSIEYQLQAFYKDLPKLADPKKRKKFPNIPLVINITGPLEKPKVKPDFHSYLQYVRQSPDLKPKETSFDRSLKKFVHAFTSKKE